MQTILIPAYTPSEVLATAKANLAEQMRIYEATLPKSNQLAQVGLGHGFNTGLMAEKIKFLQGIIQLLEPDFELLKIEVPTIQEDSFQPIIPRPFSKNIPKVKN